jgi:two-component system, OmpR family, copper resistance phosphate regulon response regulator CusR
MKILLIGDDEPLASFVKMGLEDNNFMVEVAHDGIHGEKLALENIYDMIILDVKLPGLNGFELCRKIRHMVKTHILIVTSLGMIDEGVTDYNCGADDFLAKPYTFNVLLARVKVIETELKNK